MKLKSPYPKSNQYYITDLLTLRNHPISYGNDLLHLQSVIKNSDRISAVFTQINSNCIRWNFSHLTDIPIRQFINYHTVFAKAKSNLVRHTNKLIRFMPVLIRNKVFGYIVLSFPLFCCSGFCICCVYYLSKRT